MGIPDDQQTPSMPAGMGGLGSTLPAGTSGPGASGADLHVVPRANYTVAAEFARGGMGRVLRAYDQRLGRQVAVKELLEESSETTPRFLREALITARLQHPAIVPIYEAGRWPGGGPFYAMKLVSGRTLDAMLQEAGTLAGRLALLPRLITVGEAIAYAHSHRIIHRDLKPQNVLCGEYGETVVIDWGLAKDLNQAADPGSASASGGVRAPDTTSDGAILGTPAYMAPEQALGQPVDERADVYALGAMLYTLLAGHPPHRESTAVAVIERLLHGVPDPLPSGVPAELSDIVHRAMQRDPAARYPTAGELAEDLRRFQTGQLVSAHRYSLSDLLGRWLRRHRAPVMVAAVATLLLSATGVFSVKRIMSERRVALARSLEAEQHRAESDGFLNFLLFDLRARLQPIGRLDVLRTVAERALEHFSQPTARAAGTRPNDRQRATALSNLADVLAAQGRLERASATYREALALRRRLVAGDPSPLLRADLASVLMPLAQVTRTAGDLEAAASSYQEARALWEALLADPAAEGLRARAQGQLEISLRALGDVRLNRGDLPGALQDYHRARALAEAVLVEQPGHLRRQLSLAATHERIGNLRRKQGKQQAALAAYIQVLGLRESASSENPGNRDVQSMLADAHESIGEALRAGGDPAAAQASFEKGLALHETLVRTDPTNRQWQRDLAVSHDRIGSLHRAEKRPAAAQKSFRRALELRTELVQHDPSNLVWLRDLSVSHDKIGHLLLDAGDFPGAVREYDSGLQLARRLARHDRQNLHWRHDVMVGHLKLGRAHQKAGDAEMARPQLQKAVALGEKLLAGRAPHPQWSQSLRLAQRYLAELPAPGAPSAP